MKKKLIGVKIEKELYNKLQEFKRVKKYDSDSSVVREILRTYLLDIWDGNGNNKETILKEAD